MTSPWKWAWRIARESRHRHCGCRWRRALDYAVANQWEPSLFFHNRSPQAGQFLGLRLRLAPDRPAIGAVATVFLADGGG